METTSKKQVLYNSGSTIHIMDNFKMENSLPVQNYSLQKNELTGELYLSISNNFKLPSKLYGDFSDIGYYLKSFENSEKNIGIYLQGEKGTGKTLFAHKLCIDSNLPVIMVDSSNVFASPNIFDFLNSPYLNNSILLFDEFEKTFNQKDMNPALLNLIKVFDGNLMSKFMFVVTSNSDAINEYFKNRLNRIKYRKIYSTLDDVTIENIIDDMLKNKNHKEDLLIELNDLNFITMDILINIIRDINLFDISPSVIFPKLNLYKLPQIMNINISIFDTFLTDKDGVNLDFGGLYNEKGVKFDNILNIKGDLKNNRRVFWKCNRSNGMANNILNGLYGDNGKLPMYYFAFYYYENSTQVKDQYTSLINAIEGNEDIDSIIEGLNKFYYDMQTDFIELINLKYDIDKFFQKYIFVDSLGFYEVFDNVVYGKHPFTQVFEKEINQNLLPSHLLECYQNVEIDTFEDIMTLPLFKKGEFALKYKYYQKFAMKQIQDLKRRGTNLTDNTRDELSTFLYRLSFKIKNLNKVDKLNYYCDYDISYPKNDNYKNTTFDNLDLTLIKDNMDIVIELIHPKPNPQYGYFIENVDTLMKKSETPKVLESVSYVEEEGEDDYD